MKTVNFSAPVFILILASAVAGQVKSGIAPGNPPAAKPTAGSQNPANATRSRVLKQDPTMSARAGDISARPALQAHAKPDSNGPTEAGRLRRASTSLDQNSDSVAAVTSSNRDLPVTNAPSTTVKMFPPVSPALTQLYRVGPLDVLDIQLAGNPARESTLFTVLEGGLLEYPLAGTPISAAGLTTNEIANLLKQRIKILENPQFVVTVRDYASHQVTVTGFVAAPGKKTLRREAVPLYALLAEALVLPEAARATITRQGRPSIIADLKDPNHSATLVVPGDVIKVSGLPPMPTEFFFIGGAISSPGQKPYHSGITLTQAILASGGTSIKAGERVRVSRLGANGRLAAVEHNLRKIQTGKTPDPVLQKGDRIEVLSTN
jgi:protein involved in polysaccharide export with SLBB domain